jgi:hypothetical protein
MWRMILIGVAEKVIKLMIPIFQNVKLPGHRPGLPGHVVASRKRAKEISF